MRVRALAFLALIVAFGLSACRPPQESSSQAVAADLHSYLAELAKWEPKERTIFQAVDDVEKSQFVDDDYVVRTLKSALPTIDEHIRRASTYQPLTPEIVDIHDHYKQGYEQLKAAMEAVIAASSSKNYVALANSKADLKKSRTAILKAFRATDIMTQEHEAELEKMDKAKTDES